MGIFLIPHGIGYRFSIGHIDIPRLIVLAVATFWFVGLLRGFFKSKMMVFEPGTKPIGILVMLILSSGIVSSNPFASTVLAGQLCILWFVFGIAYNSILSHQQDSNQLNNTLIIIFTLLFLFGLYEVIFQTYLVPPQYRMSFWGLPGYEWITSRIIIRSDTILAQGPFMWNHALSGLCAAGSGVVIYAMDKNRNWGLLFTYIFVLLLTATGVRAGFYAVAIAFLIFSLWFRRFSIILHFALAALISELFYFVFIGNHAPIFYAADLSETLISHVPSWNSTLNKFALKFSSTQLAEFFSNLGIIGVKLMGFILNLAEIEEWWLLGHGFGSFQRPSIILSSAIQYDDPGIIQLIFLESGIFAGFLFVFILIRAIQLGLKYDTLKYYSVGITAWSLFALSSWEVWPLLLVMIFVLKIFKYDQTHRSFIVEKHRSPH